MEDRPLQNVRKREPLGSFSNEDGNAKDNGSEKSHSRLTFYFFVCFIWVLFSPPYTLWAESD